MNVRSPEETLALVWALPAAAPLLGRLPEHPPVYLVGGAVRDLLLGGRPYDLDLVVEGDAAELARSLQETARVHDRFGTSTVTLGGLTYDIARARREHYARPGALPDVEPAGLEEDLLRRDFTVNAAALALTGAGAGELKFAPHAREDLAARQLRVLHDRSFIDDPTRLFRLARYASRLGFAIEPHTRRLAQEAIAGGAVSTVSGPRIGAELRLLAREGDPVAALGALRELELDRAVHPGFRLGDEQLARSALELLPPDGRRDRLALAAAARGIAVTELLALLDGLAFEAVDRDVIAAAATRAERLADAFHRADRPSEVLCASDGPVELVALAGALGPVAQAREWMELRHVKLAIDGNDLLEAGVPQGPLLGVGLSAALDAKVDGRAGGREQELEVALQAARGEGP